MSYKIFKWIPDEKDFLIFDLQRSAVPILKTNMNTEQGVAIEMISGFSVAVLFCSLWDQGLSKMWFQTE